MVYRNVRRGSRSGRSGTAARRRFGGELRAVQHQTAVGFGQQGLIPYRGGSAATRAAAGGFQRSRLQGPVALQQQRRQNICRNDARQADINVEEAWKLAAGDPSLTVAIVDQGIKVLASRSGGNMWINKGRAERSRRAATTTATAMPTTFTATTSTLGTSLLTWDVEAL